LSTSQEIEPNLTRNPNSANCRKIVIKAKRNPSHTQNHYSGKGRGRRRRSQEGILIIYALRWMVSQVDEVERGEQHRK